MAIRTPCRTAADDLPDLLPFGQVTMKGYLASSKGDLLVEDNGRVHENDKPPFEERFRKALFS